MGLVVNATPQPLYPRERDSVPIVYEGGWDPGPVWTSLESFAFTGFRSSDLPARSESLYRLSYPGPITLYKVRYNIFSYLQKCTDLLSVFHTGQNFSYYDCLFTPATLLY